MNKSDILRYITKKDNMVVISFGNKKSHRAYFGVNLNDIQMVNNNQSKRGINVLTIKEIGDKYKAESFKIYDFWDKDCNTVFQKDIQNISPETIIIMGIKEDGSKKLNIESKKFLKEYCKSRYSFAIGLHHSWALVIKKVSQDKIDYITETYNINKLSRIEGIYYLSFQKPILPEIYKNIYSYDPNIIKSSDVKKMTKELKIQLKKIPKIEDKMKLMENYYQDKECYIISCGPSLNNYCQNLIKNIAGDSVVITIKQALNFYKDITDFHVLNWCNYQSYNYINSNIISLYLSNDSKINNLHDITFSLDPIFYLNRIRDHTKKIPAVARSFRFNDYLFSKKIERPEGPGIIYEIPIYLAIHLGCKKITILGWDLNYKLPSLINNGLKYMPVENSHFYGSNKHTNRYILKIVNENDDIVASTPFLYRWLQSLGIELYIISDQSRVDKIIPRLNPEIIYHQKNQNSTIKSSFESIEI